MRAETAPAAVDEGLPRGRRRNRPGQVWNGASQPPFRATAIFRRGWRGTILPAAGNRWRRPSSWRSGFRPVRACWPNWPKRRRLKCLLSRQRRYSFPARWPAAQGRLGAEPDLARWNLTSPSRATTASTAAELFQLFVHSFPPFHSIPFRPFLLFHPFHSDHSIPSIPFHSIPFHFIPFHSA